MTNDTDDLAPEAVFEGVAPLIPWCPQRSRPRDRAGFRPNDVDPVPETDVGPQPPDYIMHLRALVASQPVPTSIDGFPILGPMEELRPSRGPAYIRIRLNCAKHADCFKHRNLTFCQNFGQMQIVGFLGRWHAARTVPMEATLVPSPGPFHLATTLAGTMAMAETLR
mgnify:CR=1 FL=1